jgi:hypothetical protein
MSSSSPLPWSCLPSLKPVPRKLKRSTGNPKALSAFIALNTTLLWSVSTKEWVGMGDQHRVRGVGRAAVEQGFEASSGTFEKKRLDG